MLQPLMLGLTRNAAALAAARQWGSFDKVIQQRQLKKQRKRSVGPTTVTMDIRGPSSGPVDELEQGTGPPLSPVEACDSDRDGGRRDELQEKGRAALRARLFASQSKTSGMLPDLGACMNGQ